MEGLVNQILFDFRRFKVYSHFMKSCEIRKLAEEYGIILVYLFGSQAEKGAKYLQGAKIRPEEFSDLDVAVAFENPPSNAVKIYGRLYKDLSEVFDCFSVDLIFTHEVDTLFQYEIIKGMRIFEKDASSADEFEERIMKMAEDLAFKKRILNKEILEAIKDGYFEFGYNPSS
ncbi:MAG: nucleotidyltransferase domain-containing protein [Candidatus Aminicenantales bacterium]